MEIVVLIRSFFHSIIANHLYGECPSIDWGIRPLVSMMYGNNDFSEQLNPGGNMAKIEFSEWPFGGVLVSWREREEWDPFPCFLMQLPEDDSPAWWRPLGAFLLVAAMKGLNGLPDAPQGQTRCFEYLIDMVRVEVSRSIADSCEQIKEIGVKNSIMKLKEGTRLLDWKRLGFFNQKVRASYRYKDLGLV